MVLLFLSFLTLPSCRKDYAPEKLPVECLLTLNILIPELKGRDDGHISRAIIAGEPEESEIETIALIIFDGDGQREVYKAFEVAGIDTDPMWDPVRKTLRIAVTTGPKRILCVANWPLDGSAGMPELESVGTYEALFDQVRTHDSHPQNPPVMSGVSVINLLGDEESINLELTRQIARVRIFPMVSDHLASTGGFELKVGGIRFLNMASHSYLFARPDLAVPSQEVWNGGGYLGSPSDVVTATVKQSAAVYPCYGYIPEHVPTSEEDATIMVIKVDYNGTESFYSLTLNGSDSFYNRRYALQRNHSYDYYITFRGYGSATEEESYPQTRSARHEPFTYDLEVSKL